jgi:hypothetical protein
MIATVAHVVVAAAAHVAHLLSFITLPTDVTPPFN